MIYLGRRTCRKCGDEYTALAHHLRDTAHKIVVCPSCRQTPPPPKNPAFHVIRELPPMPDLSAGLCWGADDDTWYPVDKSGVSGISRDEAYAISICRRCPVRDACLDWAMRAEESHGIWGGTTPRDRARIRAETR